MPVRWIAGRRGGWCPWMSWWCAGCVSRRCGRPRPSRVLTVRPGCSPRCRSSSLPTSGMPGSWLVRSPRLSWLGRISVGPRLRHLTGGPTPCRSGCGWWRRSRSPGASTAWYGGAPRADRLVARGGQIRRDAAVAEARRNDEREYLAALHDTASATLLMVGAGVADREHVAAGAGDPRPRGDRRLRKPAGEASRHQVDAEHSGRRGAPARWTVRWDVGVGGRRRGGRGDARGRRPRGTHQRGAARRCRRGHDSFGGTRTIVVEVADGGAGFDPTRAPHRYGVTRSIVERMTRTGGHAEVISSPGNGTTVRLEGARRAGAGGRGCRDDQPGVACGGRSWR